MPGVAITSQPSVLSAKWTARCTGWGSLSSLSRAQRCARVRAQSPTGAASGTPSELQLQSHENLGIPCNPNSFSLMIQQGPGETGPRHRGSHSQGGVRRPPALIQHTLSQQQSPRGCPKTVPVGRKESTPTQRFLAERRTRYPNRQPLKYAPGLPKETEPASFSMQSRARETGGASPEA